MKILGLEQFKKTPTRRFRTQMAKMRNAAGSCRFAEISRRPSFAQFSPSLRFAGFLPIFEIPRWEIFDSSAKFAVARLFKTLTSARFWGEIAEAARQLSQRLRAVAAAKGWGRFLLGEFPKSRRRKAGARGSSGGYCAFSAVAGAWVLADSAFPGRNERGRAFRQPGAFCKQRARGPWRSAQFFGSGRELATRARSPRAAGGF